MTVLGLQNLHIVARDTSALAEFWQRALGLEMRFADGERWVQLKAGEQGFAIASAEEGVPGQVGAVPVFEVDDMGAQAAVITAAGGEVVDLRDMGSHGRVLTFRDPEGNWAQLFCRAA